MVESVLSTLLALDMIRTDGGTQPRAELNYETVNDFAQDMLLEAKFPPVTVYHDGSYYWLADGFHRYHAAKQICLEEINVEVRQGTRRDAVLYSVGANATHGLRRTNADKRRAVETLLRDTEWAKWSNREIAKRCAVDEGTVRNLRSILTAEIPQLERTYITKHGTVSAMNTSNIGAQQTLTRKEFVDEAFPGFTQWQQHNAPLNEYKSQVSPLPLPAFSPQYYHEDSRPDAMKTTQEEEEASEEYEITEEDHYQTAIDTGMLEYYHDGLVREAIQRDKEEREKRTTGTPPALPISEMSVWNYPPKEVKPGDVWQLGKHLLYCGDSSSQEFIQLTQQAEVTFAFADPPYNAGVAEWDTDFAWKHDYLIDAAPIVAVTPGISAIKNFMRTTKMSYKWSMSYWIDNGMTRGALGFGNWVYVALFTEGSLYRNAQDLVRITEDEDMQRISITGGDHDDFKHKGRKPLEMMTHIVGLFAKADETVVDPFLGTGTTLIACEDTGRRCIGAELNPEFCGSIIKRWERRAGEEAVLCK